VGRAGELRELGIATAQYRHGTCDATGHGEAAVFAADGALTHLDIALP
jgi:hypothetical protein